MFQVIPCVDIQKGRAVRLFEGDPERETVYFERPLDAAKHWANLGAEHLHLVDLDAALGQGDNRAVVQEIAEEVGVGLELGGGIRSTATAKAWLAYVDAVVIGTAAITQPEMIDTLLAEYPPERIIVTVDAKDGHVAVKGWQELSTVRAITLAERCAEQGIRTLIYTDITRDGTLKGVNPDPVRAMREVFPYKLIAGGGVATDADLVLYEDLGLQGAIVGRALYEGTVRYPRTA